MESKANVLQLRKREPCPFLVAVFGLLSDETQIWLREQKNFLLVSRTGSSLGGAVRGASSQATVVVCMGVFCRAHLHVFLYEP